MEKETKEKPMTEETKKKPYRTPECAAKVGNAAKLREALERIIKCQCTICPDHGPLGCEAKHRIGLCKLIQSAREILAAPPRNCDVGTPDEQASRFFEFCHAHKTPANTCSPKCPFYKKEAICNCITGWGQLPYEAPAKEGGEA